MATRLDTIREERIKKLEGLKKLHINPYPSKITLKGDLEKIYNARESQGRRYLLPGVLWE